MTETDSIFDFELIKKLYLHFYKGENNPKWNCTFSEMLEKNCKFVPLKHNPLTGELGEFVKANCKHGEVYGWDENGQNVLIGVMIQRNKYDAVLDLLLVDMEAKNRYLPLIESGKIKSLKKLYMLEIANSKIVSAK